MRWRPTSTGARGRSCRRVCAWCWPAACARTPLPAATPNPAVAECDCLWAQAKWSRIDFDYLEYAGVRWGEYHRRKAEFVAQAAAAAPAAAR